MTDRVANHGGRRKQRGRPAAVAAVAALALVLGACGGTSGSEVSGEEQTLTIAGFGGAWAESLQKNVVASFEDAHDVKIKFVEGGDPVFLTKLGAAKGKNPPYDIVTMSAGGVRQAVGGGFLDEIDTSKIAAWDEMVPELVAPTTIDGKEYGLPTSSGRLILAYRTDEISTAPTSWTDLADPAYRGHVGLLPPQADVGVTFLAALANVEGGEMSDSKTMDEVFSFLEETQPNVAATPSSSAEMQTLLERGDVWIAPFPDGRAATLQLGGAPIGLAYPEEGAVPGTAFLGLATGSEKQDLAYQFLDYMATAEAQGAFCSQLFYICGNANAEYTDEFESIISTDPAEYGTMATIDYEAVQENLNGWSSTWQSIFG